MDDDVTPAEVTTVEADTAQTAPSPSDDAKPDTTKADDTDWKAHARQWEKRAKENSRAADELAKLKAAQMTEQEKLQADRDQAAQDAETAKAELAVERAARKHGITADKDLELLAGLPADKVDAVAKRIATTVAAVKAPIGRSGNEVGGAKQQRTPTTLADAVAAAYRQ